MAEEELFRPRNRAARVLYQSDYALDGGGDKGGFGEERLNGANSFVGALNKYSVMWGEEEEEEGRQEFLQHCLTNC